MMHRKLGKMGLEVSTIGLGCMGMSQSYPPFPVKSEMIDFIREAVDMGEGFFDTSEVYGIYTNIPKHSSMKFWMFQMYLLSTSWWKAPLKNMIGLMLQ